MCCCVLQLISELYLLQLTFSRLNPFKLKLLLMHEILKVCFFNELNENGALVDLQQWSMCVNETEISLML